LVKTQTNMMHRHVTDTGQEQLDLVFLYSSSKGRKWHTKNCKWWEHDRQKGNNQAYWRPGDNQEHHNKPTPTILLELQNIQLSENI